MLFSKKKDMTRASSKTAKTVDELPSEQASQEEVAKAPEAAAEIEAAAPADKTEETGKECI